MTADEFRARYALLDQVAGGGVRTFHAVTPTAGVAMVHFVDGGVTPYNLALLGALERLEPARRARVRDVTAVDGSITVVTELLPEFRSLPAWLGLPDAGPASTFPASATTAPADPAPLALPARDDPAGSIRPAHGAAGDPAEATASAPAAYGSPPAPFPADAVIAGGSALPVGDAEPGGADAPRKEPGEFTRLFLAADLTGAPAFSEPDPPSTAAGSAGEPSSATEPAPRPAPPPAAAAPAPEPGEFTRLFRAPLNTGAAEVSPRVEEAPLPPAPAAPEIGAEAPRPSDPVPGIAPPDERRSRTDELASFRAVALPPADPPHPPADPTFPAAPAEGAGAGGATGVFSAPGLGPDAADAAPADAGGRGEFSRLFQRLDLPAWALSSRDRDAAPPPPTFSAPEPLPQADDDYVDRLLSQSPRLGDDPPAESLAEPAGSLLMPAFSAPALPAGLPQGAPASPPAYAESAAPVSVPAAPATIAAPARSATPLLAGLILVVVLALTLVAFFALR